MAISISSIKFMAKYSPYHYLSVVAQLTEKGKQVAVPPQTRTPPPKVFFAND